jgi:hypothetical protein
MLKGIWIPKRERVAEAFWSTTLQQEEELQAVKQMKDAALAVFTSFSSSIVKL